MSYINRKDIVDYQTYQDMRESFREQVLRAKELRRIHVGPYLTFLFENKLTIRYQIQEMMRLEKMVRESDIEHEIKTYNGLLGAPGELGCTLLIEIEDIELRDKKLKQWLEVPKHLYVKLTNGQKIYATFDEKQIGDDRLSSVQYLKFNTQGAVPIAVGCDHSDIKSETFLKDAQRTALTEDLMQDLEVAYEKN